MMVIFTPEAKKQYDKLRSSDQKKIQKKILLLEKNPLSGKKLTGELKDRRSLRSWPYRIIYFIKESKKETWVISILHRQGAYK